MLRVSAPTSFELQPATEEDFEELLALRLAAMRESLEHLGRFDPERSRARFRASFSPMHTRHILFDAERVGFVAVKPQAHGLLLDHFYLHPRAQGHGLGAAVLRQICADADRAGLSLSVGALRGSAANRFYERHGFVRVGQTEFDIHYERATRPGSD